MIQQDIEELYEMFMAYYKRTMRLIRGETSPGVHLISFELRRDYSISLSFILNDMAQAVADEPPQIDRNFVIEMTRTCWPNIRDQFPPSGETSDIIDQVPDYLEFRYPTVTDEPEPPQEEIDDGSDSE